MSFYSMKNQECKFFPSISPEVKSQNISWSGLIRWYWWKKTVHIFIPSLKINQSINVLFTFGVFPKMMSHCDIIMVSFWGSPLLSIDIDSTCIIDELWTNENAAFSMKRYYNVLFYQIHTFIGNLNLCIQITMKYGKLKCDQCIWGFPKFKHSSQICLFCLICLNFA